MVLTSCSYMLNPMIAFLREQGIPFHNPYRITHGGWNPLRGSKRILSWLKPQYMKEWWSWVEVEQWIEPLMAKGVLKRGAKSLVDLRTAKQFKWEKTGEEPLSDIAVEEVFELFATQEGRDALFEGNLEWYFENVRASRKKALSYPVRVARENGYRALIDDPRVVVGTIHSVKGGEADNVYVYPDVSRQGMDDYERNPDPTIRQFYVAFTRARSSLILCSPGTGDTVMFPRA